MAQSLADFFNVVRRDPFEQPWFQAIRCRIRGSWNVLDVGCQWNLPDLYAIGADLGDYSDRLPGTKGTDNTYV
jgi:hypothetical protein